LQVEGDGSLFQFGLPSLLQLIGMERKTCTLTLEQDGRTGRLYMREGDLLDAECGALRGEDAAVTIAGWSSPSVVVSTQCPVTVKVIESSLGYVILEAMRREDESASNGVPAHEDPPRAKASVWPPALPSLSLESFEGALGVCVVSASGRILCSVPSESELGGWAVLASKLLGFQRSTLRNTAPGQHVEEIVLTTVLSHRAALAARPGYARRRRRGLVRSPDLRPPHVEPRPPKDGARSLRSRSECRFPTDEPPLNGRHAVPRRSNPRGHGSVLWRRE